ncbi:unnamed protein product [Rodentolepis nana]|uniref:Peptidylprolyl isomerase n=1 Tax=Rodentolepis nana TaxID=102285 RepID=A0A0R3TB65_RODNA|nr:unnamed protein product [Rodentolepis nana]
MLSPKITKLCWGSIAVEKIGDDGRPIEGEEISYRDAKVWPGGSSGWDWNKTGEFKLCFYRIILLTYYSFNRGITLISALFVYVLSCFLFVLLLHQ